jgi:hypothetical protein
MVSPNPVTLERQINRVSRRLYLQTFLDHLVWCLAAALVLAAGWFFLQPYAIAEPAAWLRWAVAGGLVATFTGLAALMARFRAPSRLVAALSLDERFGLKERVTTSLTLGPDQVSSPAGLALLADVNQRVSSLDVTSKFPVSMSWSALAVPVCMILFCAVAFFYEPPKAPAVADAKDDSKQPPVNVAKVDEAMKELKKKTTKKSTESKPREELERLEAKLEEIANRPRKTKEELRERYKELKSTEDLLKKHAQQLGEKSDARQQALKKMDKLNEGAKEGPAKDLQKALSEGNMEQAKQALDKMAKKLDSMSPKEKEQLAKQMKEMGDKLKQLANNEEKRAELDKLKKEGKIDEQTYDREKKALDKQAESLKDLKDLAQKMGQCKKCLEKGDAQGAKQMMDDAAKQLDEMDGDSKEMEDLREQMKKLKEAKNAAKQGMGKDQNQDKDVQPADSDEDQPNSPGGPGAGRRPMGKDAPTRSFDTKARVPFDPKGKKIFDGYTQGQNFRKKSTSEIIEDIEQASQESSEALEQQRISRQARDMAKGYFRNLGGQDAKKVSPKPEK